MSNDLDTLTLIDALRNVSATAALPAPVIDRDIYANIPIFPGDPDIPKSYANERPRHPNLFARVVMVARAPGGSLSPGFSVTVDGKDFCGCCHDLVLGCFPHLKPVVDLHLSDLDGAPMHTIANAVYWLSGALPSVTQVFRYNPTNERPGKSVEECRALLRSHLRISSTECQTLLDKVQQRVEEKHKLRDDILYATGVLTPLPDSEIRLLVSSLVANFCEELRPRWQEEAKVALELIRAHVV